MTQGACVLQCEFFKLNKLKAYIVDGQRFQSFCEQFIVLLQTFSTKKRGGNQVEIHPQFLDFQRMFIRG